MPLYSTPPFGYSLTRGECLGSKCDVPKSDEELMSCYRRGDLEAFDQLYTRYEGKLFGYLVKLTRDRSVAEEIFQETFLSIVKSAHRFEEKSFSGWIFTIARRQWIDRCRHESRTPQPFIHEAGENLLAQLSSGEESLEEQVVQEEFQEKIKKLLATIAPEQVEVFLLRVQGELEYHEIAEVVGAPLDTVKSRMRYAVATLSKKLKGEHT